MGKVLARIGKLSGFGGIIWADRVRSMLKMTGDVQMQKIQIGLSLDQKDRLAGKLEYLHELNVTQRLLQDATSMGQLFERATKQLDYFFKPDAVAFVRNLGPKLKLEKSFRLKVEEKALSVSKETSPIVFSVRKGFAIYIADTHRGPIILSDKNDELFEATSEKSSIKLHKDLRTKYKSVLVTPIFMDGSDIPLGAIEILWTKERPKDCSDYHIDLKIARLLAGFVAPTLYEIVVRQNIKELPPGFPTP